MLAVSSNNNREDIGQPTFLIDASIYIFRYYFSLPDHWFSEKEQWSTAAVYGYTAFLVRLLRTEKPKRIAACFDESLSHCFRNDIYPDYKSSRALPDEALAFQLQACRKITELLGISTFASLRYEADDLLGSLYQKCLRSRCSIAVLTRDKDLSQLLTRPQDFLWDYGSKNNIHTYIEDIESKWGVRPDQLVDYLALVGDTVDDIPGVPGIGAKTAQQLLLYYGNIDNLLAQLDGLHELPIRGAKRTADNLHAHRAQIAIAQQLATIVTHLPIINSVNELAIKPPANQDIECFCHQMGFPKLFQSVLTLSHVTK